jgi:succinate dehydrogenase/fumarate reductase flavoprotein subunit
VTEQKNNGMNRRDFLKKSAVIGGAAGIAGSLGLPGVASAATSTADWLPKKWDYAADVVVAGYGFAGQAVAIEAARAGSSVFILEKMDFANRGGNSRVCGQGMLAPSPAIWADYRAYIKEMTEGQGLPTTHGPDFTSDDTIQFYIETARDNVEWFKSMGYELTAANNGGGPGKWIPFFPTFPGADAIAAENQYWTCSTKDPAGEAKSGNVWANLEVYISKQKSIQIKYETPVKRLIQNPKTREVLGVVVTQAGKEKTIKARKAVAICAGGYEYNEEWARNFQQMTHLYSIGAPSNTGETIQMAWDAGAQPRNMAVVAAPTYNCAVVPDYKAPIQLAYTAKAGAFIMVGRNNKRFKDEYRAPVTGIANKATARLEGALTYSGQQIQNGAYVKQPWPEPIHYIFDEAARMAGPLFSQGGTFGWATCVEGFKNSADNSAELAKGWIVKADTIKELATKIGRDPDQLQASVDRWNADCAAKKDTQFDLGDPNYAPYARPATRLVPFTTGPFYALQIHQCTLNTQGGMTRNTNGQVLGIDGKYIPRLYAAGENGDIWTILYQCMSNVGGGCFAYGRHAGMHAAALKKWDAK